MFLRWSPSTAQAGFELTAHLPQSPVQLGLQACATTPSAFKKPGFLKNISGPAGSLGVPANPTVSVLGSLCLWPAPVTRVGAPLCAHWLSLSPFCVSGDSGAFVRRDQWAFVPVSLRVSAQRPSSGGEVRGRDAHPLPHRCVSLCCPQELPGWDPPFSPEGVVLWPW